MSKRVLGALLLLCLAARADAQQAMAVSETAGSVMPGHQMAGPEMASMVHDYGPIQVPDDSPLPELALVLHRDAMSGINLHLALRHYALGPPEQAAVGKMLNGHAHLYVNGKKIQRLYGPDVHLPAELFKPGVNLVLVSLNAHSHAVWQDGDKQLLASSFINPEADKLVLHSFSSAPLTED
ncbi:hypothetical protein LZP73_17610 [Shewanella sp. AS16]|uniref:hypothetical protein n=1 Tax=Shewanella sp. AS16 TaxID=2907625 RepID=UPI001F222BB6|nr:hypothetical protein [Shewanella sp. AS16]MCE9687995.1 hypothetical protein [Shewanella sp. AS16]